MNARVEKPIPAPITKVTRASSTSGISASVRASTTSPAAPATFRASPRRAEGRTPMRTISRLPSTAAMGHPMESQSSEAPERVAE